MSSSRLEELRTDIDELTRLSELTSRPKVKDLLLLDIRKLQTEITKLNEQNSSQPTGTCNGSVPVRPPRCYDVKLTNYAWDQSDKFIKLFVTLSKVHTLETAQVLCAFTKRSVELQVRGLDNKNYFLTINNLLQDIVESTSHWKVKTDMVVVFLAKATTCNTWKHLTMSEQQINDSKKSDVPDMDSGEDPSAGLMNLMKKIYNEGDDEMKRTIAKAWTEGQNKGTPTLD